LLDPILKELKLCRKHGKEVFDDAAKQEIISKQADETDIVVIDETHILDLRQLKLDLIDVKNIYGNGFVEDVEEFVDVAADLAEAYRAHCYAEFDYRSDKTGVKKTYGYPGSQMVPSTVFSFGQLSSTVSISHVGYERDSTYKPGKFFDAETHLVHVLLVKMQKEDAKSFRLVPRVVPASLAHKYVELSTREEVENFGN